jgi:hypothetical protein
MRINFTDPHLDLTPDSLIRKVLDCVFGSNWVNTDWRTYQTVEVKKLSSWYLYYIIHCEQGPAIIKTNGDCEWWLEGVKLPVKNEKEFKSYMKNKVFW